MRTEPIQLIGSAYADKVRSWSSQDVCNWIPTQAEVPGTRTPQRYATAPGLRPYVEVPESEFSGTVVRGMWNCNNKLFAVIGTQLYQISNTGVAIPRGTIPGVQRVKFAHNWINEGNELLIVNGYSGYVYSTVTQELKKVVDAGYPGAIDVVFIDNYLVQIEPARRFAFNSALADASNYNELDRFTSEVNSDLLVGMAVTNNELLLFSEKSSEFFYNSGDDVQPFKSKRIYMNRGCAGRDTINLTDNTVFWLGDDGCFYRLDGYSPVRISTRPVEEAIRGLNWAQAFSLVWNDSGHSVVYWTFPDGHTWGYDASTQKWHRRASRGMRRWRVNCMATWQDRWFAGDFQAKRIWEVDWDYYMEGDQEIERECTSPVTHDNQCRVLMPRLEVIMDVGNESSPVAYFGPQPERPTITGDAPDCVLGESRPPYSPYQYSITGDAPLTVSLLSGTLPPGLSISKSGLLSGQPTTNGLYSFTLRVTDKNGLWADLVDIISVSEGTIISPTETWKYLQTELTDSTDYSGIYVDDSSWSVGAAPFASSVPHPYVESVGWPNIKNSNWSLNTKLWLRLHFSVSSPSDISFFVFVDNYCTVWLNGELVMPRSGTSVGPSGPIFNHQVTIPMSKVVTGDNVIVVLGEDYGSYSYMSCRLDYGAING